MKLGDTILYVESVEQTLAFHERASGLNRGRVTVALEYGEVQTGDTKLAFAASSFVKAPTSLPFTAASPAEAAPPMELGLVTGTVEQDCERGLAAGAVLVKQAERKPWGQRLGCLRGNKGLLAERCAPIAG